MGLVCTTGAKCICMFGTQPVNMISTGSVLVDGKPALTIADVALGKNLAGNFGQCMSLANPVVAAATAAALGVLSPQPCTMVPMGTWIPSKPTVLMGGKPVLTNMDSLMCGMGMGKISITDPGQTKVLV